VSNDNPGQRFSLKRLLPVVVLLAGLAAFFVFGLDKYLSFETLREHRQTLLSWVEHYGPLSALAYIAIYIVMVAFSLPGGAVMTVTGGFLFGAVTGTLYSVIGAAIGATVLFLIARSALGEPLRAKAGPSLKKMEAGFRENALNYLLVLRLVPLFPFFLVNLAPAFLGVPLRTYVIATFVGIIPGSFIFSLVGSGLGSIFEQGKTFSIAGILTPRIVAALVGLAVLALIPVIYKKVRR
jgi:Uncharacterized conserved protein